MTSEDIQCKTFSNFKKTETTKHLMLPSSLTQTQHFQTITLIIVNAMSNHPVRHQVKTFGTDDMCAGEII